VANSTQPTAEAEAPQGIQVSTIGKECIADFFENLAEAAHQGQIPAHYPAFTEEHAEILWTLGYLDF
jgi:hypothetical protein